MGPELHQQTERQLQVEIEERSERNYTLLHEYLVGAVDNAAVYAELLLDAVRRTDASLRTMAGLPKPAQFDNLSAADENAAISLVASLEESVQVNDD